MGQGIAAANRNRIRGEDDPNATPLRPGRPGSDDTNPIGIGLTPFIRENDINFAAKGLKPAQSANLFFDEIRVNNFCQRASYINVTANTTFTQLKINEGLYGATSKAYAEILGTSVTGTENQIYLNDNFITLKVSKTSGSADLSDTEYLVNDIVYQTEDNLIFNYDIFTETFSPDFSFGGKVKRWEKLNASDGVLVIEPLTGSFYTDVTNGSRSKLFNSTRISIEQRQISNLYSNNRFQAGETLTSSSGKTITVSSANAYVALSSVVTAANTINSRSIILSSNNVSRDGLSDIVGNTISIVSGTNMGFKANVVATSANTTLGWLEAIVDKDLPANCTSNSVYSVGEHKCNDVGGLFGIFHIPAQPGLRWLTGERKFTITDTATHNDNAYKMRAFAAYTALGKTNTNINTRNPILNEQTPASGQAPTSVTQQTPALNDRKFMCQTFFTPRGALIVDGAAVKQYGMFLTSVDLYFKAKPTYDSTKPDATELLPFTVEIVPVTNGLPDPSKKAIASQTLDAAQIVVSGVPSTSNASTNTRFTFADPVQLEAETEYAIQLKTESGDYQVWTAKLGDIIVDEDDNQRRVSEQPYVGNLFKSQNASNWNPLLNEDLMFRIHRASFSTSASDIYLNLDLSRKTPGKFFASNLVFDAMSLTTSQFVPSPTSIAYAVKTKLLDGTESDWITLQPSEKYGFGKDTNISSSSSSKRRLIENSNVAAVNVRVTLQTTDNTVSPIVNWERAGFLTYTNIINNAGIHNNIIKITEAGTGYTNTSACTFANVAVTISGGGGTGATGYAVGNVNPAGGNTISHIIITNPGSGYTSTPTISVDAPSVSTGNTTATALIYGETGKSGDNSGNIFTKYQTKILVLEKGFVAGDLVVDIDAIKPSGTDVQVYFKVLSPTDSESINNKDWVRMSKVVNATSPDQKTPVKLKYKYSLNGRIEYFDGTNTMPVGGTFNRFMVKLRLTAADPTVAPFVDTLTVTAVPGD